jgi:hypothetical protein
MPDLGCPTWSAGLGGLEAEPLGQGKAVSDVADPARWYSGRVETDLPRRRVGCCQGRFEGGDKRGPVADAGGVGAEALVLCELGLTQNRCEPKELTIIAASDRDQAATTSQGLVWGDRWVLVAHARWCLASLEEALGLVHQ